MNQTIPRITEVPKPIHEIVADILQYQDSNMQRNPFRVVPTITGNFGITNPKGYVEPTLSDPESLRQNATILYYWGRTDEQYMKEIGETFATTPDVETIARLIQHHQEPVTFISWEREVWAKKPKARAGFEVLERLIQQ